MLVLLSAARLLLLCRDMQVVIEKLQAGARKAQEVANKIETPCATAQGAEELVSPCI